MGIKVMKKKKKKKKKNLLPLEKIKARGRPVCCLSLSVVQHSIHFYSQTTYQKALSLLTRSTEPQLVSIAICFGIWLLIIFGKLEYNPGDSDSEYNFIIPGTS